MPPTDLPSPTVADLLANQARRAPAAPALLAPGRPPLDYAGLLAHASSTGTALSRAGIGHDDRIAIVLPNGPELAVAVLATAAHAACAPLNSAYGETELRFHLGDVRAKALIVSAQYAGPARAVARELGLRCLDASWTDTGPAGLFELSWAGRSPAGPEQASPRAGQPADDATALILHTSGTTSRPKIVPLSHRNLCRSAANVAAALALRQDDRCLNVMPLFHIHGIVAALLASLSAGASVACTPGMREGSFLAWLDELQPTWYTAAPTIHQTILRELRRDSGDSASGRLRFARSSSAPLPPPLARELEAALGAPVIEAYGMTEAAHQVASNPLPPAARKPGSVGLPAGPEIAIIGDDGRRLARGETGEIVIRGENVMRGYEADRATNRAAFVDGWFRTGDRGRIDADGFLTIAGRLKEIINRGGEKVSPHEVDVALLEHPDVHEAVAFAVPHPTLGEDVAAAVVARPGSVVTEGDVRRFLIGRLAESKIPSRVLIVTSLPAGATGKIRRVGLAERLAEQLAAIPEAPANALEACVAEVFAEVLALGSVGANDNFFMLGGDSLRGGQVLGRVRERLGAALTLLTLFRSPTVRELAEEITRARESAEAGALQPMPARGESPGGDEAHSLRAPKKRRRTLR